MAITMKIEGMKELQKSVERLGKLPQKCVTKAAKKGANIAYKDAKGNAPVDEGNLKKGIKIKPEKKTKSGKKVYQVTIDPAMNDIFVKESKEGKRSYYPASMEFGYFTRSGRYIPGYHYLKNSLTGNAGAIEKEVVTVLTTEVDKEWAKR